MSALKEFLRTDGKSILASAEKERLDYERWNASVLQFFETVRGWISGDDPDHLIAFRDPEQYYADGESLYPRYRLRLSLGNRVVTLQALSPYVLGGPLPVPALGAHVQPLGRIDMTTPEAWHTLYFGRVSGEEIWFWKVGKEYAPVTPQAFESRLTELFRCER